LSDWGKEGKIRILRVIARMNIGGPAYHVSLLSGRLDPNAYETLLVAGRVGPGEGSFEELAEHYGARLQIIDTLGPQLRPLRDLRAFLTLRRAIQRFRPDIVHTHTAKAGMLGRIAALTAFGKRPITVHTFHGQVLEGYFGRLPSAVYRLLERWLARVSDRLVAVSNATVDDLVRLRVAPREKFEVIPVGLDLDRFLELSEDDGDAFREEVGAGQDDLLLVYAGRLVPIKRLDRAIRAVARVRAEGVKARLAIVGDGPLREELTALCDSLELGDAVRFLGYQGRLESAIAGADVAILTSDNEGTPVFLIEAAAGARPAVATSVGGIPDVVRPETGLLVLPEDESGLAQAVERLDRDPELRTELGRGAREHVRGRFAYSRLLDDIDRLYRNLLDDRAAAPRGAAGRTS
jgi:glycosyltransferase involved in cell wall biosynthesis